MAEPTKSAPAGPTGDRIQAASVRKDGTLDQHNPEFIDKETALAATKVQFAQQAVSALDDAENRKAADEAEKAERVKQDPTIEARIKAHDAAASAAEKRAEQVVGSLTR